MKNRRLARTCASLCLVAGTPMLASGQYQQFAGEHGALSESAKGVMEIGNGASLLIAGSRMNFQAPVVDQAVFRLNSTGSVDWARAYDWGIFQPAALESAETPEGNFCVVGVERSVDQRLTAMLLDPSGSVLWSKRYDGGGLPFLGSFNIEELSAQASIVIEGDLTGDGRGTAGAEFAIATTYLADFANPTAGQFTRLAPSGNVLANKRYSTPAMPTATSFRLVAIDQEPGTSNLAMTGTVADWLSLPSLRNRPVLLYTGPDGSVINAWYIPFPVTGDGFRESHGASIVFGANDKVFVCGFTDVFEAFSLEDCFVLRFDLATGTVDWARAFRGFRPGIRGLSLDASGNLALAGTVRVPANSRGGGGGIPDVSQPALLVLDGSSGSTVLAKRYRTSDRASGADAIPHTDGGWQIVGTGRFSAFESAGAGGGSRGSVAETEDIYVARTDTSALTGCHETDLELFSMSLDLTPVAFSPVVTSPENPGTDVVLSPAPLAPIVEDDCPNVPCTCLGDANSDFLVNFSDVTTILAAWLSSYGTGETGPGDSNCDSEVNFADVTATLSNWLNVCFGF